ncbi:histone-fold-containing protein [Hypoxylon sp. FL0543]|nr:histone-fold-containing protein [Hypoxylon sp. FL0543]
MPPRKSDASARPSNVSMAQFVYDGSDADISSTSLRPAIGAAPVASRAKPTPSIETDPPRPAEAAPSAVKDSEKKDAKESSAKESTTIEDLNLPKSIITRLAKGVLPPNTQIQANAVIAMCKSATVFINHLAAAANEKTQSSNKKTIMPADVFAALEDIEFEFMRERLEAEFKKFNEVQTTKRSTYRRKKRAEKVAASDPNASMVSNASAATTGADANAPDSTAPRAAKKQRPNAPDDSAMDVDGAEEEPREPTDAESEPEQEQEQEEEDDDEENEAAEEEEDEEDEEGGEEDQDRLEEREPRDDHDDALDDGDSD